MNTEANNTKNLKDQSSRKEVSKNFTIEGQEKYTEFDEERKKKNSDDFGLVSTQKFEK